jgi:hypothetical protein
MAENLYQLRSKRKMLPGEYFPVDGIYDIHGIVIKCEHAPNKMQSAEYLNLVRGTGKGRKNNYN